MKVFSRGLILSLAIIGLGVGMGSVSAAVFTVNIFDLKGNRRSGQSVSVTVTAVDKDNNVVTDPKVNFDGDKNPLTGALIISTQKNVTAGRTVVTVDDDRVSSVSFTFTGAGLLTTADQRFLNKKPLEYDVAVPEDFTPPVFVQCPPFCFEQQRCSHRFSRRCRR